VGPFLRTDLPVTRMTPDSLVWKEGMPSWRPACETELADLFDPMREPAGPSFKAAPRDSVSSAAPCLEPPVQADAIDPENSCGDRGGAPKTNYVLRHWRGELSLARSYWVNIILLGVVLTVAWGLGGQYLPSDLAAWAAAMLLGVAFTFAIAVWQGVGFARAVVAAPQRGVKGGTAFLAWCGLVLFVGGAAVRTVQQTWPMTKELMAIAAGDHRTAEMKLTLLPSGHELEISGGLRAGSARKFQAFLESAPHIRVIHISSVGGRIREAVAIADLIAQRGLTTYVAGRCVSAGTLIFLGGKERYAHAAAKIGFHAASFAGITKSELGELNQPVVDRMVKAGVSRDFVNRVTNTPPSEMWYPSFEEMKRAGVVTGQTFGEKFGLSSGVVAGFDKIEASLGERADVRALRRFFPDRYQMMVAEMRRAVVSGKSEAEVLGLGTGALGAAMTESLPRASDAAILETVDLWLEVYDKFFKTHPDAVLALFIAKPMPGGGSPFHMLKGYPREREIGVIAKVIESAAVPSSRNTADPVLLETSIRKLASDSVSTRRPRESQLMRSFLLSESSDFDAEQLVSFVALLRLARLELTDEEAANLVRALLSEN
jgi:hypothetical protein